MIITHTKSKLLDSALESIETLSSEARVSILGDTAKQNEYTVAEQQAIIFKNIDYKGTPPAAVESWARAKNWTAKEAADDILRAANLSRTRVLEIRDIRLTTKEAVKNASSTTTIDEHMANFKRRLKEITGA